MLTKDNVTIGIEWRFGPYWPGQRCGAKTRRGTACRRPANKRNGRCRVHGGASTGAKTEEGRARISAANLRHGKFTKAKLERSKNGRGRIVPLTNTALMTIEALPRDDLFVFPVRPDTLKQSWRRLVKRAGINDLRFHDLRHEAISRLLEMGLTIPEAASVSGHRTASMLARSAHPDPVKVREKMLKRAFGTHLA